MYSLLHNLPLFYTCEQEVLNMLNFLQVRSPPNLQKVR